MYRDLAQWSGIRDQILRKGVSIRQVVRRDRHQLHDRPQDARLSVAAALSAAKPQISEARPSYRLSPADTPGKRYIAPSARLSIKAIYERIRDTEGFRGSYGSVTDYARTIAPDKACIWEYAYDLLTSLEKKRAIDFDHDPRNNRLRNLKSLCRALPHRSTIVRTIWRSGASRTCCAARWAICSSGPTVGRQQRFVRDKNC